MRASPSLQLVLLVSLLALAGCGATTLRVGAGPTFDTFGRFGFEATVSGSLGTPLDFHHRSHHFLEFLAGVGGVYDSRTGAGGVVELFEVDYLYWALQRLDIRVGAHLCAQQLSTSPTLTQLWGVGANVGVVPLIVEPEGTWLLQQIGVGLELRVQYLWSIPAGHERGRFALPLVFELSFLATGD